MIGHKELKKNFIKLADEGKLYHSYGFFGPERVGKKLFALSLANYLENKVFEDPGTLILSDCLVIAPDAEGTLGIDQARQVKNFLATRPNRSSLRTVIIDEAEALTREAQNALLKITEEPGAAALIILILKDPELILPTLESRLQKAYFGEISKTEIQKWLEKDFEVSAKEAEALAEKSFGQPGLAWRTLKDENFQEAQKQVLKLLKLAGKERKDFIKELVKADDFEISRFIDILALELGGRAKVEPKFWHKLMELRGNLNFFNLNPRLQLEALFSD